MTLFTGILDPDVQRANRFLEGSRKLAPDLPWLKHTDTRLGRLSLALDSAPRYPIFQEASGRAVFVLGDILGQPEPDSATWLEKQSLDMCPEVLGRQNGYYIAGMVDEHDAIYVAADQLGLILPSPDQFLTTPDEVVDGARYKSMIGLHLQLGMYSRQGHQ